MMELLAPLETDKRLPLYRSAKLIQAKAPFGSDEASLKKIVEENRADLAEGQDRAVGRTIKEREGMKKSVREGTFRSAMDAADAYTEARGVFAAKTNGGAENLVGPLIAAKFRLGDAVRGAASAGVFAANKSETDKEKWSSLGAAGFTYRKNVDYTQVETAKKWRAVVENALEEYRSTLEFAEALQSDSLTEKCDSTSCRMSRAVNEIEVVAEGVVAAYERVGPRPGNAPARLGTITTPYFSRIIPGNACFKKQETCSLKNCTGYANGKRCKAGELVNVCTARQVPIRCSKKAAN